MRNWMILCGMLALGTATACGGDVCEDAAAVLEDKCGGETSSADGECTGAAETAAQCIVDNDDKDCTGIQEACFGG